MVIRRRRRAPVDRIVGRRSDAFQKQDKGRHMTTRHILIFLFVTLLAFPAMPGAALLAQTTAPLVSWYTPRKERSKLYSKVVLRNSPGHKFVIGFWITPTMAQALVSHSIDRENLSRELAESRYQAIRPKESHLVFVATPDSPMDLGTRISVRLVTKQDKVGIEGSVQNVPFRMPFGVSGSLNPQGYILAFPRLNTRGERVINGLDDDVVIVIDYSGEKIYLRSKPKRFASGLDDL